MKRVIRRYSNRKMYDTQASAYVTLEMVAELVRGGDELRIIDNDTGQDLTAVTFAQIIFEEAKRKDGGMVGLPLLRRLIQQGGEAVQEFFTNVDRGVDRGREALESVREIAEKRVKQLVRRSGSRGKGGRSAGSRLEELLEAPQRQLEHLQQRIDTQVRNSIERVTAIPVVRKELRRLEESLRGIEQQLTRLRGTPHAKGPARSRTRRPPREPRRP